MDSGESLKFLGCFETYKLNVKKFKVYFLTEPIYTDDYNIPSQQLCEKLGMRKEGFFKEIFSFVKNPDGTPHYENTYQYAILKKEWLEQQKAIKAEA